ncbi:MAG: aryl-sulfate sulfotransferase [Deltaproteobacteria bacterium]|nr:aryl-sulfate sulfotransferase [Deltaproteobacteria bacterium]
MKKKLGILLVFLFIALSFGAASAYEAIVGPTGVLKYDKEKSYGGYTLFAPMVNCKTTYLIDMEGNVVHKWESEYTPGAYAMLLPNGNLLRGGVMNKKPAAIGGAGGIVQEIDWDGNVVWEYKINSDTEIQHHCFTRMPNGNTLILAWEAMSIDEAIAKGRDPKTIPLEVYDMNQYHNEFWVDFVREVDKKGKTVWEYHVKDHIGTGPNQYDINYILPEKLGGNYVSFDWSHFNTVEYIPEKDLVLLNSRNFSEFYLIDHKTGKMVYRWGNPSAYGQGEKPSWYNDGDQKVFGSHSVTYLGKDRFMIFDNGSERAEGNRSSIVIMDRKTNEIVWQYYTLTPQSFYSFRQGAAQMLPNGNVHVTSTNSGHLFEVTEDKKIVWEYVSPVFNGKTRCFDEDGYLPNMMMNMIHRSYRYAADYPGLKNKDLSNKVPLTQCPEFYKIYQTDKKPE